MSITHKISLQDQFAPNSICFGCGPANKKGLQIKSFQEGNLYRAEYQCLEEHQAFPGMINGGIIGSLFDCHCNWSAAMHLMQNNNLQTPSCTVTAEYTVKLLRPTPLESTLQFEAKITESHADRARVEATLTVNNKITATCTGLFVAVKEGHPAWHRWQ